VAGLLTADEANGPYEDNSGPNRLAPADVTSFEQSKRHFALGNASRVRSLIFVSARYFSWLNSHSSTLGSILRSNSIPIAKSPVHRTIDRMGTSLSNLIQTVSPT